MTYSALKISGRTVSFTVAGTGCDTPQLYLSYPAAATDAAVPAKVLRKFKKICATGQGGGQGAASSHLSSRVNSVLSFTLTDKDVSNWDVATKAWTVTKGKFGVMVGSSSRDIRLTGWLTVQ